jgi:hypothetical protein
VHDALDLHSSQRPREKGEVEGSSRHLELGGACDLETHPLGEVGRQISPRLTDSLFVGIDCEDVLRLAREAPGQPALAGSDL